MSARCIATSFAIAAAVIGGCGAAEDTTLSGAVEPLAAIAGACDAYATVWCAGHVECEPAIFASDYGGVAECIERRSLLCVGMMFGEGSGLTSDPDLLRQCAGAMLELSTAFDGVEQRCEQWFWWETARAPPLPCRFAGRLADGSACATGSQCGSGACRASAACGTCGALGNDGDACGADTECAPGHACANETCVIYRARSAICSDNSPCEPHLRCVAGKCAPLGAEGAACSAEELACAPWIDLSCAAEAEQDGTCELIVPADGACDDRLELCPYGKVCAKSVCEDAVADGLSCGGLGKIAEPCFAPAACVSGRCAVPDAAMCNPELPP